MADPVSRYLNLITPSIHHVQKPLGKDQKEAEAETEAANYSNVFLW